MSQEFFANGLSKHRDFLKFWRAQAVSTLGTCVTTLAIPLVAVHTLRASPLQMSWLSIMETLPMVLFCLHGGVWIDRGRRIRLMIGRDLVSACALALVPLARVWGGPSMPLLCAVAFTCVSAEAIGGVAHQAYLATLVGKDRLIEGYGKIGITSGVALVAGPGIAGFLAQILAAPLALLVDVVSFIFSAATLSSISFKEPEPIRCMDESAWKAIRLGFSVVFSDPFLRKLTLQAGFFFFINQISATLLILRASNEFSLNPMEIGFMYIGAGLASLVFSLGAANVIQRLGLQLSIGLGFGICSFAWLGMASLSKYDAFCGIKFGLFYALLMLGTVMWNMTYASSRSQYSRPELLGRVISTMRFCVSVPEPLGALLGGVLATKFGFQKTFYIITSLAGLLAIISLMKSDIFFVRKNKSNGMGS